MKLNYSKTTAETQNILDQMETGNISDNRAPNSSFIYTYILFIYIYILL